MNTKEIKLRFNIDNEFTIHEETICEKINTYTFDGKIFFKLGDLKPPYCDSEYAKLFIGVIESYHGLRFVGDRGEFGDNLHKRIIETMKLVSEKNESVSFEIFAEFREFHVKSMHEILSVHA